MAFVAGLSRSQVLRIINNYASIAPATMALITQLSAQINDPNDPAAVLIGQMAGIQSQFNGLVGSVNSLNNSLSGKQDIVPGISSYEIQALDNISGNIQSQIDQKANRQNAEMYNTVIHEPTLLGNIGLPNNSIPNSKLQNSSVTINGTQIDLGGSASILGQTLPSQSNNSGKYLKTDGTSLSWATAASSSSAGTLANPSIIVDQLTSLGAPQYLYGGGCEEISIGKMDTYISGYILMYGGCYGSLIRDQLNGVAPTLFKKIRMPKLWFKDQGAVMPNFMSQDPVEYVYADVTMVTNPGGTSSQIYFSFTSTELRGSESYIIGGNGDFRSHGEISAYSSTGRFTIDSELAYLDGITSNVQQQINALSTNPTIVSPTFKLYGDKLERYSTNGGTMMWFSDSNFQFRNDTFPSFLHIGDSLGDELLNVAATRVANGEECYVRAYSPPYWGDVERKITSVNLAERKIYVERGDGFVGYGNWLYGIFTISSKEVTNISPAEIKTLDGATSNIQQQLNTMSSVVDAVPATVTSTLNSALSSIFVDPTIKRPTIWTESQSGEAFYANDQFRIQQSFMYGYQIYSSSHPNFGMDYAPLKLAVLYYGAKNEGPTSVVLNNIEAEISGVTGTNANLINGIKNGRVVAQLYNDISWFTFEFGQHIWSEQADWSNAKIKWGNIRTITSNELKSLDNVSGNIQNQIDSIKTNGVFDFPTIRFGGGFKLDRNLLVDANINGYSYQQEFEFNIYLPSTDAYTTKLKQDMLEFAQKSGNIEDYMGMPQPYTVGTITVSGVVGGDPNINGTHTATITNTYSNPDSFRIKFSGADWLYDPNWNPLSDISNLLITCGNTIKITQPELEALDGITGNIQQQIDAIAGGGSVSQDILAIQQDITTVQQNITTVQQNITTVQQGVNNKANSINPQFSVGTGGFATLSNIGSLNGATMTTATVRQDTGVGYSEFRDWLLANGAIEGAFVPFDLTVLGVIYPVTQDVLPLPLPINRGISGKNTVEVMLNSPYGVINLRYNIGYDWNLITNNPVIVYGDNQETILYNGQWSSGMGGASLVGNGTTTATIELSGSVFIQENLYKILCTTVAGDLANNTYRFGLNNNSITGKIVSIDSADGMNVLNMTVLLDSPISGTHGYNAEMYLAIASKQKSISSTEIGYLDGLTGNIQQQINYILSLINP